MTNPTHAVLDLDKYKYSAAYVGEKRTIEVTHKTEGWSKPYKSRTEFWGHWKKKAGGALALMNKERDSIWLPDEFEIQDIQTPEPIANVLHSAKLMVEGDLYTTGAKSFEAYLGEGESFRVQVSTLLKYKDRDYSMRPLALDAVTEYLRNKFKADVIRDIEADDMCVISAFKQPNKFIIGEDKDYWGCPVNFYDVNRRERGIVNCNKLGHLFLDEKGNVRGEGRIHLYYQIASQDDVDVYKANCFSDVDWGSKGAYKALVNCKTDKECFQVLVDIFKMLYPEPKTIIGWRGDEILIDWFYVLQEMFWMANMKKTVDEPLVDVKAVLERLGVQY